MRPRSLLFFSSLLVLTGACAKASSTGGEGGDPSGPGGGTTTGNPTTGSNTTSGNTTTGSNTTSTGSDTTSAASTTSSGSNASSTSSGPACAEDPCKLTLPQCGCAAGEQCSIDGSGRACIPTGNTGVGQACSGPDCAPGLLCVNTSASVSTCGKFCDVDADCAAPGGLCIIGLNDGTGTAIPGVTMCTENCDPTSNVGCPAAGTACEVAQESAGQMRFLTHCTASGAGQQGTTCVTGADCAPTFGCFNTSNPTAVKCLKNCKASAPSCPAGTQCYFFMTPELVGNEEYGACL